MEISDVHSEDQSVPSPARFTIRLFSVLADRIGSREVALEIECPATADEVVAKFASQFTPAAELVPVIRVAVNAQYVEPDHLVSPGDEIAFITPTSGG